MVLPDVAMATVLRNYAQGDASIGNAVQSIAVYSTVDLICSLGSELPVQAYSGDRKIPTPGNVLDPGGDGLGLEDWTYRLLSSWLLAGNAYGGEVAWRRDGKASQVDLLHPDDVTCTVVDGRPVWRVRGEEVDPSQFVHWRVNPVAGRLLGLSRIEMHAASIGISLSATRFGRQWFAEGAHPSSLLTNSEVELTPDQAQQAKARYMALQQGSREPLVLGKGWDHKQIQISPEESQFLETSGLSEAQCARIFGPGFAEALGYETGGSMTYANVVDRRQDLLVFSLNRWLRRVERVLSSLLPAPQYVRLNREALLESTTLQRYQAHQIALDSRWRTVNEVREIEDLPPVAWGDEPNGASAPQPVTGVTDGNPAGA